MDEQALSELRAIKDVVATVMDRIVALELDGDDADDPGPLPLDGTGWTASWSETPEKPPEKPGPLDGVLDGGACLWSVTDRVNRVLAEHDNVIRPSLALRLLSEGIDACMGCGLAPFDEHILAWNETRRVLEKAAVDVAASQIDDEYAWCVKEVDVPLGDVISFTAIQLGYFEAMYLNFLRNEEGSTFGELTPGECLYMLYYVMRKLAPMPGAHPSVFSMRHSRVKQWFEPQPWAKWTVDALKILADKLRQPVGRPAAPIGTEPPPFSAPPLGG